jgi:hypothetical protein
MSLINIIAVATPFGNKEIQIHHGDISMFKWPVDLLVFSAFQHTYHPVPNTVIESLQQNCNVNVRELADHPQFNLRIPLNCWINKPKTEQYFKQILCIEGIKSEIETTGRSTDSFDNLFGTIALLSYKNVKIESVIMPLLGTGMQKGTIQNILPTLLEKSMNSLNTNPHLKTIIYIERDREKALLIDKLVNELYQRNSRKTENLYSYHALIKPLEELADNLAKLESLEETNVQTINELSIELRDKNIRFFQLGIQSRKILEILLSLWLQKTDENTPNTLQEKITNLKSRNVADWMISNIHTIRVYGNYAAHSEKSTSIPSELSERDLIILVQALNNFIQFYLRNLSEN